MRINDENTLFIIISDHGFTKLHWEVNINRFLELSGLLHFNGEKKLVNIDKRSRAFALDPGRVYVHSKDRFPEGTAGKEDMPGIKRDIIDLFSELHEPGSDEKVIRKMKIKKINFFNYKKVSLASIETDVKRYFL